MTELFENKTTVPLAELLRADNLSEVVGQDHILGTNSILLKQIENQNIKSTIFWGPPGCGKTTIARLIAKYVDSEFISLSAIFSGISDLKEVFNKAINLKKTGKKTILFIDEIHRFNKSQQDSFLPVVEDGTITLIGATTENPSFELNSALLSRCQVLKLNRLNESALLKLIKKSETVLNKQLPLTDDAKKELILIADGDGRHLLNIIETIFNLNRKIDIDTKELYEIIHEKHKLYDKDKDYHYNLTSALHKSIRGSDVNAALYWCARMISAGEQPKYILRRLIRIAMEDIGMADPNALQYAISSAKTYERLGSPEGDLAIANLVIYLSTAPKSNSGETAWNNALNIANKYGSLNPPIHLINPVNSFMKNNNFGKDYIYDPDTKNSFSGQNYWPDELKAQEIYKPSERGFEKEIQKRLNYWNELRKQINNKNN